MKLLRFISCFQHESITSNRYSIDAAAMTDGSLNINSDVCAPFDLDIVREKLANNYNLPIVEENQNDLLLLEKRGGGAASFFNRLLSREEATGYSSRIYYRAPAMGRVPFHWEAEPGKPKTMAGSCDMENNFVDHDIIPPLSPPPVLRAKSHGNSDSTGENSRVGSLRKIHSKFLQPKNHGGHGNSDSATCFSGQRMSRVGLLHKIHNKFLQPKRTMQTKLEMPQYLNI